MTGKISEDADKVVAGTEKVAASLAGTNYGILVSSIATYLASLTQTLTGKTINAASNTISNIATSMFAANVVDVDGTLAANSDTRLATQKAVKTYADALIAAQDAMVFKGVTDCSANPNYPAADRGHTYRASVAGKIGGASGTVVEVGDMFICLTDSTASGNQATVGASWSVIQTNIDGAVVGPASSTSGNLVSFNGTNGKTLQDSGVAITTGSWTPTITPGSGTFTGNTLTVGSATYQKIGNWVMAQIDITLTTLGSGTPAGLLSVSLPFTPAARAMVFGFEQALTDNPVRGTMTNGTAQVDCKYLLTGATVIATGARVIMGPFLFKV